MMKMLQRAGVVSLLLSMVAVSAQAQTTGPFPDVDSSHPQVQSIQFMKDSGVFEGYPDGTYQPDRVLNRAEQLKVYMLLHGLNPSADDYKNCFPDVGTEWFARFVCYAKSQRWVQGYPDGNFRPAQEVNKVEALKMLGEIQGWDLPTVSSAPFDDTPTGEWYTPYVQFAKDANLIVEKSGNFNPAEGLTRAMTAEVLFRSLAVYALGEEAGYDPTLDSQILAIDVSTLPPPTAHVAGPDFGDAPESGPAGYAGSYATVQASFPTLLNTDNVVNYGAHTLDSSMEWLGANVSIEDDADDLVNDSDGLMNLVNNDAFDDGVKGLNVSLVSIPPPATLTFDVSVANGAPQVPRYVNAVVDLNMDGEWSGEAAGGEKEWVVKNMAVNVTPGTTKTFTSDPFAYSNGWILTPTSWMRVVVSREPIDEASFGVDGWDGSGQFEYGEVEDYYIQLPDWDDGNGGSGGGPGGPGAGGRGLVWGKPAPVMQCPPKVRFRKDSDVVWFACTIANYGGKGDAQFDLWEIVPGVAVTPVTGVLTLPTAPPGFPPFGVVGNPQFQWFKGEKGTTPSTWGYTVVGIDPESTVEDSVIDLGLVPGDLDEGYEADADIDDLVAWTENLNDYFLFGGGHQGPMIVGATFSQMNDENYDYHIEAVPHVKWPEASSDLAYVWSSPSACGNLDWDGVTGVADWTFSNEEAAECFEGSLELLVADGVHSNEVSFDGAFVDADFPVNDPPAFTYSGMEKLTQDTDDPQEFIVEVFANDPEGDELTFNFLGVDCGTLSNAVDNSVHWEFPLADFDSCSPSTLSVEVSDGEFTVEDTFDLDPVF